LEPDAPLSLRCMLHPRARSMPGAKARTCDTRVLNVPAVTSVGSALSVTRDNAARPDHEGSGVARVWRSLRWYAVMRLGTHDAVKGSKNFWRIEAILICRSVLPSTPPESETSVSVAPRAAPPAQPRKAHR
jgi:hypothetical protein